MGFMYTQGLGISKDYFKALEYYQKAANAGIAPAYNNLGVMYAMVMAWARIKKMAYEHFKKPAKWEII
ncbi:SEL1-like repeat protein [Helicobacter baculiformis]|uniref:beta-lactamase n=1 Tax=Helicobacter baculiformis TaxID=427351 RepID=A0ABV7ZJP2_9HELI|nr:SEL1-like repeat protein [Helicobacter baculiformis]